MKALSVKQPYADLIIKGIKDVENRSWWTATRERVYIHAGLKFDQVAYDNLDGQAEGGLLSRKEDYDFGAIIGEVDIVDCKFRHPLQIGFSKWHDTGYWGFILSNPVKYDKSIPCRGQLGFFEVDINGETAYSPEFRTE